ncbi:MAG TPA: hypothetical protein PKA27_00590 [Fimbriimonadaceae bacterium]|nr:hypothetical protein [Fimbriimonadaceae bacterium]
MKRRVFLAILVLILCPIMFGLLSFMFPKRYTSSISLLVDQTVRGLEQGNPLAAIDDIIGFGRARSPQTQLEIITGSKVLMRAIETVTPQFPDQFPDRETTAAKVNKLISRLRVDVSRESDVITLRVTSEDSELSAAVANAIGQSFIDISNEMAQENGNTALQVLNKQIDNSKTTLSRIDGEIAKFKGDLGVSDLTVAANGASSTISALELRKANAEGEYEGVIAELDEAERILTETPKELVLGTGSQLNPQLSEALAQLGRAKASYEASRARYLDDHPTVVEQKNQVDAWEKEVSKLSRDIKIREDKGPNPVYQQQIQNVATLKGRKRNLQNQLSQVTSELDYHRSQLNKYSTLEKNLAGLIRDRTVTEANYLQLVQRKDVLEAIGRGRSNMANIVSPALAYDQPSFPDTRLFILMGVGLGIVLFALILMPKAPTESFTTVVGADRTALAREKAATLKSTSNDTAALGGGSDNNSEPSA